jgi:hypothetical protein
MTLRLTFLKVNFMTQEIYLNIDANNSLTPLHRAVMKQDIVLINKLIDQNADLRAKDKMGRTPLDIAKENAKLYPDADSHNPHSIIIQNLEYAIKSKIHEDETKQVKDLIASGKTTAQDQLQLAFSSKNPKLLRYLVEQGARLCAKDKEGRVPFVEYVKSYTDAAKQVLGDAIKNANADGLNAPHRIYAANTEFNFANLKLDFSEEFAGLKQELSKMKKEGKFSTQPEAVKYIEILELKFSDFLPSIFSKESNDVSDAHKLANLGITPAPKQQPVTSTSSPSSTPGYKFKQ